MLKRLQNSLEMCDADVENVTKKSKSHVIMKARHNLFSPQGTLMTNKIRQRQSHGSKRRKSVPLVTEVHAREDLLDVMALYSFSIQQKQK